MPTTHYNELLDLIAENKEEAARRFKADTGLIEMRTEHTLETPLIYLAIENYTAEVEWLIAQGADVNAKDSSKSTALVYAANLEYEALVAVLLKHGAHVNQQDHLEKTALFHAAGRGNLHISKLLLDAGASPLISDGMDSVLDNVHPDKYDAFVALFATFGFDEGTILKTNPFFGAGEEE